MELQQPTDIKTWRQQEWGMRLPDGSEIWPPGNWHGIEFATEEGRATILKAILGSEGYLSLPTEEIVGRFKWLQRFVTVTAVFEAPHEAWDLDTPQLVTPADVPEEVVPDPPATDDPTALNGSRDNGELLIS